MGDPSDCPDYFDYVLPPGHIASRPCERRDESRMLVIDRKAGTWKHHRFRDLPGFFRVGDLAALNDSRVIRARLVDGNREVFLLEEVSPQVWKCLVRPGKHFRVGMSGVVCGCRYEVEEVGEDFSWTLRFAEPPDLEALGRVPLPPYIHREADEEDDERYQTVYAKHPGSVAAPTAGLHFTPEILARIPHAFLTLHVGAGTFLPVKAATFSAHPMHEERYEISVGTAAAINRADRIVAIGTTVVRVLESLPEGEVAACSDRTDLLIRPPFSFRRTGALLTNFHLPRSTLLALVCAFAGRELTLAAYREAVRENYRFYSYGDCMLIT
jgi:S-adenosylmethionine:tRNA ribosyltransferase-isomerase